MQFTNLVHDVQACLTFLTYHLASNKGCHSHKFVFILFINDINACLNLQNLSEWFGHFSAQLCFRPTLFGTPFSAQF